MQSQSCSTFTNGSLPLNSTLNSKDEVAVLSHQCSFENLSALELSLENDSVTVSLVIIYT